MRQTLRTWNDRLNWAIERRGVKKAALARACAISRASVQEWADGKTTDPKLAPFFAACEFLSVRPRWLALGEEPIDPLPDDVPAPRPLGPEWTELLIELAHALAMRSEEDQRRILELVQRLPEEMPVTAPRITPKSATAR